VNEWVRFWDALGHIALGIPCARGGAHNQAARLCHEGVIRSRRGSDQKQIPKEQWAGWNSTGVTHGIHYSDIELNFSDIRKLKGLGGAAGLVPSPELTSEAEVQAAKEVAEMLRRDPDLRRSVVLLHCSARGLTFRGAKDRVWPTARKLAGLPVKAKRGRRPRLRQKLEA
jgi:hypothetical protein